MTKAIYLEILITASVTNARLTNVLDSFHDILSYNEKYTKIKKKAFDRVPHKRLLIRLKSHGIQGDVLTKQS